MGSGSKKATGSFVGTGAELFVQCEFAPRYVKVSNRASNLQCEKHEGELDGGSKTIADGTRSALALAAGISFLTEDELRAGKAGFRVGTDASVNEADKQLYFLAVE